VGNNTRVFFFRDPLRFPDLNNAVKRHLRTNRPGGHQPAHSGKRKHQADGADAQERRVGSEAEDVAASFRDAGEQGECGSDSDADAQRLHNESVASSERRRYGVGSRPHHGGCMLRAERQGSLRLAECC